MAVGSLVLCYHAVSDTWNDPLATGPQAFERQIKALLRRGYIGVTADEALANRPRTLHVTFDDAFRSVAGVLELLERLGVPVTIFACAGFADDGGHFRVPELRDRTPADEDELLTMPWEMLRELVDRGVEIGSHTVSHPHLPTLGDDELRTELQVARELFADRLGRPCRFLAYPYGHHDGRVQAAARRAGYAGAFTLDPRTGGVPDRVAAPRVGVYRGDGALLFRLKTSRLRPPLTTAAARVRSGRL